MTEEKEEILLNPSVLILVLKFFYNCYLHYICDILAENQLNSKIYLGMYAAF